MSVSAAAVYTIRMAQVVLFSVVSVRLSVCLSVPIITKFSGHHPILERADKFKNDYIG